MIRPHVGARGAEAGNRSQQVVGFDSAPHFAGCRRGFQQSLERGAQSVSEVGWQRVICRVARVKCSGEPAFSGNETDVTLHPSSQRLVGFMLGRQNSRRVCASVDLALENGHDQVRSLGKMPVNRPDAHPGPLRNLSHRSIHSGISKHRHGCLK